MVRIVLLSGTDVSTRPLSPGFKTAAFRVRQDLIGDETLASYRSLYLRRETPQAAPKCFSGSTSYLRV